MEECLRVRIVTFRINNYKSFLSSSGSRMPTFQRPMVYPNVAIPQVKRSALIR